MALQGFFILCEKEAFLTNTQKMKFLAVLIRFCLKSGFMQQSLKRPTFNSLFYVQFKINRRAELKSVNVWRLDR